ncbi:MAG: DUF2157 domain-containing protein [Candidatus Symbiothrix sp.]|jgi:uncharacterized membrane protein|nr:DUF2157 domain-containing protein [Candidatus Symbiothrix sp.]
MLKIKKKLLHLYSNIREYKRIKQINYGMADKKQLLMKSIQQEDIHIISRHSNQTEQGINKALKEIIYNDRDAWQKFLRLFFISLGIGFTVSGIVFFFAYNWADLHKFFKIGLAEGLIIVTTSLVLLPKINTNIRKIILTGAGVLVGVLFAVFGQIYQTGANAYDFFLVWTVFITLWVLVSNFAPLWLFYLILINTTLILYSQQVANDWSEVFVFTLLFILNTVVLIVAILLSKHKQLVNVPNWFLNTVALASISYATIGIIIGIFFKYQFAFPVLIIITAILFGLGIWQGLKTKSRFYLSVIPFSLIIIISALLVKISDGEMMLLLVSLFIVVSVTLVIKGLIEIQKKWTNEK